MLSERSGPDHVAKEDDRNAYAWIMPVASTVSILVIGILVAVGAYLFARGASLESLRALSYPGVAVVMFVSSATVLLPAPGFAAVVGAGGFGTNPLLLGLFAAVGSSAGELTGYLVGLGSRKAFRLAEGHWTKRLEFFMRRWGFLTVTVMAAIPNPFFDAVGIVAGSLGYPARRLWFACLLGNSLKYTALALFGGTAIDAILHN